VQRMYAENPAFVKEFASLTGRGGNALLNELKGPAGRISKDERQRQQKLVQPVTPPDAILGKDMQMLNSALAASDASTVSPTSCLSSALTREPRISGTGQHICISAL